MKAGASVRAVGSIWAVAAGGRDDIAQVAALPEGIADAIDDSQGNRGSVSIRRGIRIGVDVGTVRVGAPPRPLTHPHDARRNSFTGLPICPTDRLADIVRSHDAIEDRWPSSALAWGEGISAKGARKYARRIKKLVPDVRVAMVDERMTSNQAHARLRASGTP